LDINAGGMGTNALGWAADFRKIDICRQLLAAGAEVNWCGSHRHTALMMAALRGHVDVLAVLLEHGADINAQCECGFTALRYSMEQGHFRCADFLRARGGVNSTTAQMFGELPRDFLNAMTKVVGDLLGILMIRWCERVC
jgi:ankyrin repeat protein